LERSSCNDKDMVETAFSSLAESELKERAQYLQTHVKSNDAMDFAARAEGRSLIITIRYKRPIDKELVDRFSAQDQTQSRELYCSGELTRIRASETHIYYGSEGERLGSFSLTPADCPGWSSEQR